MTQGYHKYIFVFLSIALLKSCTLEPKYQKPASPIAKEKITEIEIIKSNKSNIVKEIERDIVEPIRDEVLWRDFFTDKNLQKVIEISLENNRDLKISALNIEAARSYYGISRAALFPQINAINLVDKEKSSASNYRTETSFASQLAITSFEIDFFGKLRNLKKSALQDFFSTQQARDAVQISLIAEVANAYLQFLLNHQNMMIALEIANASEQQFQITKMRYESGIDAKAIYLSQKTQLNQAKLNLASAQNQVSQSKNILRVLVGNYDKNIFDNLKQIQEIDDIIIAYDLLRFMPSTKLLNRPDIQQAEFNLKAANANIGAARGAFFPSIMLTGSAGYSSDKLNNLFSPHSVWRYTPQINLPIFSGLANWSNLKLSHIRKKIEIVKYEQAIENAFKELLDQLAIKKATTERLSLSQEILELQQEIYNITLARYDLGNEAKFNMLQQKIIKLQSQQQYITSKTSHLSNLVNLYKTLGGGIESYKKQDI